MREAVLPASREDVWDAITRPDRLSEWFGGEVAIDPAPRGHVEHRAPDGSHRSGFVLSADRPVRLVFWWRPADEDSLDDGSRVEFVLLEHADGTVLTVSETPAPDPTAGRAGSASTLA